MKQFVPALGWSLLILILSILPGSAIPKVGLTWLELDKAGHFAVYFILAIAIGWSFRGKIRLAFSDLAMISIVCSLYGMALEGIQYIFLSDRFFEIPDIIANISGSFLGAVFVYLFFDKIKAL